MYVYIYIYMNMHQTMYECMCIYYLSIYLLTCCSRRPNHMREAENLRPRPTPAPTPTHAIAKPFGSAPGAPKFWPERTALCSGSPQNGQKDPKTPAPGPQKNPQAHTGSAPGAPKTAKKIPKRCEADSQ